jgi:soluble lytic murein transglycosylase-like protein
LPPIFPVILAFSLTTRLLGGTLSPEAGSTAAAAPRDPGLALVEAAAHVRLGYCEEALGLLSPSNLDLTEPWLVQAADLIRGRGLLELSRFEEARVKLEGVRKSDRQILAELAGYYLARLEAAAGNRREALALLEALNQGPLAEAMAASLARTGLEAALGQADKAAADLWLARLRKAGTADKSEELAGQARLASLRGDPTGEVCAALLTSTPCAPYPAACGDQTAAVKALPPAARFARAEELFECWGYEEAAREFEHFLSSSRFKKHHARCHFLLAEIYARKLRNDREKALVHYRYVVEHGGGDRAYSLYQMGRCEMNLERYDKALELFREYLRKYPKGEFAERCRYYEGWLPYDHDRLAEALPGFDAYLAHYRKGELRSYVVWFKAWSLMRLGKLKEAMAVLNKLAAYGNDIVAGKALYWLGDGAQETGDLALSRKHWTAVVERYPLSYYGFLAWRRLAAAGNAPESPLSSRPDEPRQPPYASPTAWRSYADGELGKRLQPILDLVLVGEVAAARRLFSPLRQDFEHASSRNRDESVFWLYSLLEEPDRIRDWRAGHLKLNGRKPTADTWLAWAMEYPPAYWSLISVEARKTGLSPYFLCSIMRQESRYRRGVISWADAVGLLQLIPQTAAATAGRIGFPFERGRLVEPEVNIKLAAAYLGGLARDFREQLVLVAASYNAGPLAMRTFLRLNRGADLDFVVEEIAYNEGRNYCRKVAGHMLKYLAIYAPEAERMPAAQRLLPAEVDFDIGETILY